VEIAAYITVNLFLFSSWYVLLYQKKECLSFADRLIGTFVLALSQIIVTEMLLGVVFRKLFPLPLFFLNISLSSGILLYIGLKRKELSVFKEMGSEASRIFQIIRGDLILLCIFCFFSLSVCWLLFTGYLFPSYSWDALYYHLPMVGQLAPVYRIPLPLLFMGCPLLPSPHGRSDYAERFHPGKSHTLFYPAVHQYFFEEHQSLLSLERHISEE
jgi:hypothetical protein